MKIDLHLHTKGASACSLLSLEDLFRAASIRGVDGVCVTDHECFDSIDEARALGAAKGVAVFMGIEIRTTCGDMLVYPRRVFERSELPDRPTPMELLDYVSSIGAVAVAAHPFRTNAPGLGARLFELDGLCAVEVRNGNCTDDMNRLALEAAERMGLPGTGGSDAHWAASVACFYTVFDDGISGQEDFVEALSRRGFHPGGDGSFLEGVG